MASIISAGTTSGTSLNLSGDTSGVLQLATNGSTTAITVDTSQNVGIGTSSPQGKLDVSSSSAGVTAGDLVVDTANKTVYVGRQSSTSGDNSYLIVRGRLNGSGTNQAIVITGDTTAYGTGIFRPNNDNIGFSTLATERMRITSAGDVGIGTSSPGVRLDVSGGDFRIQQSASTARQRFVAGSNQWNVETSNSTNGYAIYDAAAGQLRFFIDGSGRVTTPNQPAFMAYLNNSFTNASPQTIVFDITQFNTGSNYSTSTGRFTAPVTGLYQFNIVVLVQGGSATMHDLSLQVNGSNYKNGRIYAPDSTVNYSCAIRLNANDYVSVYVSSTGRPIYGAPDWTYFSGFLVG